MKRHFTAWIILILLALGSFIATAQTKYPDPDKILVGNDKLPEVLLVGTFHFAYRNLDAYKVDKSKQMDILSKQKQQEIEELINYISRFKPTKIVVEVFPKDIGKVMEQYRKYKSRKQPLAKDEIEQIGFRLMEKFNLDTLYGCNADALVNDLYNGPDSLKFRPYLDRVYKDWDLHLTIV